MSIENIQPITMEHVTRYGDIYAKAFSGEPWNDPWKPEDAVISHHAGIVKKCAVREYPKSVIDRYQAAWCASPVEDLSATGGRPSLLKLLILWVL